MIWKLEGGVALAEALQALSTLSQTWQAATSEMPYLADADT